MVIEEEWFGEINLTDSATFTVPLMKLVKIESTKKKFHVTQSDTYNKFQYQWLGHIGFPDIT